MKNAVAPALALAALSLLPTGTLSFTAARPSARAAAPSTTELHGLLPGFLRPKEREEEAVPVIAEEAVITPGEAIPPEMTELALEAADESAGVEPAKDEVEPAKDEVEEEKELSETEQLLRKVKDAGLAGAISYAMWELGFWGISIPVCVVGYQQVAGHWPELSNAEDMQKVGAEAFAFVNFARLAVPLRIGLALSTTPWIEENVVKRFLKKDGEESSGLLEN